MLLERRAPVRANSYDPETRSFEAVIPTGAPVERRDFDGPFLEFLDLNQSWPESVAVLDTHRSWSVSSVIGRANGFRVEGNELVARVRLSARDGALARDIEDGILDSMSIGYTRNGAMKPETACGKRRPPDGNFMRRPWSRYPRTRARR